MKRGSSRCFLPLVLAVMLALASVQAQDANIAAARTSVDVWLSLIDAKGYGASWDTAATLFKTAVTQEKWQAAAQAARAPLGEMKSRTLKSATFATTLPGVPDGEYVVFQFNTVFEQKAAALETATAIREKDGTWHVGGYFIK